MQRSPLIKDFLIMKKLIAHDGHDEGPSVVIGRVAIISVGGAEQGMLQNPCTVSEIIEMS